MSQRPLGFDLKAAIRSVSFTPRVSDAGALFELLGSDAEHDEAEAERALERIGIAAALRALELLKESKPPLRARLGRVIGRIAIASADPALKTALLSLLDDSDPKTRRNAILALGKLRGADIESALLQIWHKEERIDHRRSLAASLGKVGGERSLTLLSGLVGDDLELTRITGEALLILRRNTSKSLKITEKTETETETEIDSTLAAPGPLPVIARCRRGLERLLVEELAEWHPELVNEGEVRITFEGPLKEMFRARTLLGFGFALPPEVMTGNDGPAAAIARALTSKEAEEILERWTPGNVRYRLEWAGRGKHRAVIVHAARTLAALRPKWINDPSRRNWEVVVHSDGRAVKLELSPRLADPRFTYRLADVPAASHPTIAAALARMARARPDDVVWDPFCGSGSELIERAKLGPFKRLIGSDIDPRALAAARTNLDAAGVKAELCLGDARQLKPEGVTLVLTNPPMGRRLLREGELGVFLEEFIDHVATVLKAGSRMLWLSPNARRTAERAQSKRLHVRDMGALDLGGFEATVQLLTPE